MYHYLSKPMATLRPSSRRSWTLLYDPSSLVPHPISYIYRKTYVRRCAEFAAILHHTDMTMLCSIHVLSVSLVAIVYFSFGLFVSYCVLTC